VDQAALELGQSVYDLKLRAVDVRAAGRAQPHHRRDLRRSRAVRREFTEREPTRCSAPSRRSLAISLEKRGGHADSLEKVRCRRDFEMRGGSSSNLPATVPKAQSGAWTVAALSRRDSERGHLRLRAIPNGRIR